MPSLDQELAISQSTVTSEVDRLAMLHLGRVEHWANQRPPVERSMRISRHSAPPWCETAFYERAPFGGEVRTERRRERLGMDNFLWCLGLAVREGFPPCARDFEGAFGARSMPKTLPTSSSASILPLFGEALEMTVLTEAPVKRS